MSAPNDSLREFLPDRELLIEPVPFLLPFLEFPDDDSPYFFRDEEELLPGRDLEEELFVVYIGLFSPVADEEDVRSFSEWTRSKMSSISQGSPSPNLWPSFLVADE